jgi:hypothetical protein
LQSNKKKSGGEGHKKGRLTGVMVQGGEAIAFSLAQTRCAEGEAVGRAGRRRRGLKLLRFAFVSGRRREPAGRAQIVVIAVPATIHLGVSCTGVRFHLFIETSFLIFCADTGDI